MLSIDWNTLVISVPQSYLTFISGNLYELDTNQFRLDVLDLLDDPNGMAHPDAFNHNTEVTLAGITFARTIEMINGYTITFENLSYRVRLIGSNNNFSDVTNLNSVSVLQQNSAGLIVTTSGGADWTSAEKENIRDALGVTGTKSAGAGGKIQTLPDDIWDLIAKIDGKSPKEALQIIAAAVAGITEDAGAGKLNFKGLDKLTNRITNADADDLGNRSGADYS